MARFTNVYRVIILFICGIAELPVGNLMLFRPATFFENPSAQLVQLAHGFGVGAYAIGLLSLSLVRNRSLETNKIGFSVLALYNLGICITQGFLNYSGIAVATVAFHGFVFLSFVFLLVQAYRQKV